MNGRARGLAGLLLRRVTALPGGMRWVVPVLILAAALGVDLATRRLENAAGSVYPVERALAFDAAIKLPHLLAASTPAVEVAGVPLEFSFRPGDTLAGVLGGLGLGADEVREVTSILTAHADPRELRPSDSYAALYEEGVGVRGVELTLAGRGRVRAVRRSGDWQGTWQPFERHVEVKSVRGELEGGSLEQAVREAGGVPVLAYMMADVLQWDLDFSRDLRLGDRFEILFEEVYLDGRLHATGGIVGMAYENRGKRLEAYRFGDDGGYYDADGRPLRKMFLRSPLRFSRVTSRFSHRRFHPILKRYRPHYGVDYGAPTGTPVRATASGVVTFAGWDRGGGRTVKVRHPNQYVTAYLHLSRFASGVRAGRRVRQGEVIGYVGATGLATAPHLDYRVQRDGRWINPLTLTSDPAPPIPPDRLPDYLAWRDRVRYSLERGAPLGPEPALAGGLLAAAATPSPAPVAVGGR